MNKKRERAEVSVDFQELLIDVRNNATVLIAHYVEGTSPRRRQWVLSHLDFDSFELNRREINTINRMLVDVVRSFLIPYQLRVLYEDQDFASELQQFLPEKADKIRPGVEWLQRNTPFLQNYIFRV